MVKLRIGTMVALMMLLAVVGASAGEAAHAPAIRVSGATATWSVAYERVIWPRAVNGFTTTEGKYVVVILRVTNMSKRPATIWNDLMLTVQDSRRRVYDANPVLSGAAATDYHTNADAVMSPTPPAVGAVVAVGFLIDRDAHGLTLYSGSPVRSDAKALFRLQDPRAPASTQAQLAPGQQVTCLPAHYVLTAPRGWRVNVKGCTDKNTPLFSAPDNKAFVTLLTGPAGNMKKMDVAALKAFFQKSKLTVVDTGYVTVQGITFTVGTLYLSDPSTQQDFTVYYAATFHGHTVYTFFANVFSTRNPSYAQTLSVIKHVLTTFRFISR